MSEGDFMMWYGVMERRENREEIRDGTRDGNDSIGHDYIICLSLNNIVTVLNINCTACT